MPGEHFVVPPHWEWYILLYFFFAGIAGGAFVIGTMLRLWGSPADKAASRLAFIISFPLLLLCPILLTLDLGQPLRFWHMLVDVRTGTPAFKAYSPISLGSWGLTIFGLFSFVMFLAAVGEGGYLRWRVLAGASRVMSGAIGKAFMVIGAIFGFFVAAYTGVLLAVSNQPVWSDTWTLGGLFLASGLSGAVASIVLLSRRRREAGVTAGKLVEADRYFIILELLLIALFLITLGGVVSKVLGGGWILLWLVVLIGTLVPLVAEWRPRMVAQLPPVVVPVLVLVGVLALRAVIIFSAQA
ncbi:MAG TPA: NrfD/PsrC family molybdoenzyme membrane anchor subunit [Candidatus Dormibacteraeota bacterium]|nr:NrfD/PsrC family molybdoenzyme membrane anchor subunit [Candidatus Dormibacteraeota bacterium]